MTITLEHTHKENYNVQTFWFKPEKPLDYTPGQFIEMHLPHDSPDERGIKHWFTLSSSPIEKLISITTKFYGSKSSSFKKTMFGLKPGARIKIVEPMGDFVLPKDITIPLVFVAGGIGITPFRSMVKWLADRNERRGIIALLATNNPKDFIFVDLFKKYGVNLVQMISQSEPNWNGEVGRLSAEKILELTGKLEGQRIYVSGPEPMVETLEIDLINNGVDKSQLVFDYFPNYKADLN